MTAQLSNRPGRGHFLSLRGVEPQDYETEIRAAIAASADRAVHVHIDCADVELVQICQAAGFADEVVTHRYDVDFGPAVREMQRPRPVRGIDIVGADRIDATALFVLDSMVRNDVPGTDVWVGDRALFDAEMASSAFDPSAYLVAQDRSSLQLVGLVRFWKNDDGPRFGLLGVLPAHRTGAVAYALLRQAVAGASIWGWPTFTAHTARPALQRRIERLGGTRTGQFAQMVWRG